MDQTSLDSAYDAELKLGSPSAAETRQQLECILADPALQASKRRRSLLRYLVEETLAGRADRLKGYTVAVAVYGRDEGFDPQSDPVVRLEARRLRRDLDGYYAGIGNRDGIRISIPKGGYVPRFDWLESSATWQSENAQREDRAASIGSIDAEESPQASDHTLTEAAPEAVAETIEPIAGPSGRRSMRLLAAAIVTTALLLAIAVGIWRWIADRSGASDEIASGPAVIVLPFEALSSGEDDRFLATGLTQELITDLMRFADFRLYSLPASFSQDPDADPVSLGLSLAVAYVVKGNLRSGSGTVRVGVQLVAAERGEVLWSETYEIPTTADALVKVQAELAARIAAQLGQPYGVVNNDVASRLLKDAPQSMATYACVLRAYNYRRTFSTDLFPGAVSCLEESVKRDPGYASAWALLGWMHLDAARFDLVPESEVAGKYRQAFDAAERAVELDPTSVVALQALSSINYYAGNHDEAERIQRKALALNPLDPDTLAQLGWRLAARGNWDEGIPCLERAIDRTASPPGWYFHLISVHHYIQGNYADALAAAERAKVDGSGMSWSFVAIAQAALGNQTEARQALAEMVIRSPRLARDPAAAYRRHQAIDSIVDRLVAGLRDAGWAEPNPSISSQP